MKPDQLTRNQKAKALNQFFTGNRAVLEQLKRPPYLNRPLTEKDYDAMTDEELEQIIFAGMNEQERANYRPFDTLTDAELDEIIKKGKR